MLTGIAVLLVVVGGSVGLLFGAQYAGKKWEELQGRRWEKKLLEALRAELEEKDRRAAPTEEEIAEAEKEVDAFLARLNS